MKSKVNVSITSVSSLNEIIQGVEQVIRVRAFELYTNRGKQPGRDLEDWQTASAELLRQPLCAVAESEFQTTVEFYLTADEVRDTELLVTPQAVLLIGKTQEGASGPRTRTFKLVSLQHPIDTSSLYADFNNGKLFCAANVTQSTLKATA